jgi:hypothetical protein
MKRYTILVEEHDGARYELAHVDSHPRAVMKAARYKKQHLYREGQSRESSYRALLVRDNATQKLVWP